MAKPDYRATTPMEIETANGPKTSWTNLGVGFKNKNGSINVLLNALPVNGKIVLIVPEDDEGQKPQGQKRY